MADASYTQNSFLGGEVAKAFQGRTDRPEYRTEMSFCLNSFPVEQGAWSRRSGTRNIGMTRGSGPARVVEFDFAQARPYTIEFTNSIIRMRAGINLVTRNNSVAITSITSGPSVPLASNPTVFVNVAVVTTAAPHGFINFNFVLFSGLGVNNPYLQNHQFFAQAVTTTTFQIYDGWIGDPVSFTQAGPFVSGSVASILEIVTPYPGTEWQKVRLVQTDFPTPTGTTPAAILLHPQARPRLLKVISLPGAGNFATFETAANDAIPIFNLKDGPYFDPVPAGALLTPGALTGIVSLTQSFQNWSATAVYALGDFVQTAAGIGYQSLQDGNLNNIPASTPAFWKVVPIGSAIGPNGFVATDIGRHMRLYSEPLVWDPTIAYAVGTNVAYGGTYWKALVAVPIGSQPGITPSHWAVNPTGARWTWGKITSMSSQGLIPNAGSTNIGNMTLNGGLAAAFNGILQQPASACACNSGFDGFVGKAYAVGQTVSSVVVWPSSDAGFSPSVAGVGQLWVYGKTGATPPSSATDGTILATVVVASQPSASPQTLISPDQVTPFTFVWVRYVNFAQNAAVFVGELQIFGSSGEAGIAVNFQIMGDPLLYLTSIRIWRMGLYSDTTGYPTAGTYHEGRLWIVGNVVGNRIDGSVSNQISNFSPTLPDGQVTADRAISYIFNAPDVSPIFWLEPDALGIVCGTQAGEWLVQATTQNLPITPVSIQAHRVTKSKCANILPARTGTTLTLVQLFKRRLLEYFADVFSGKFTAQNLAEKSPHMTTPGIEEIVFQQELTPIIWCRMADGTLRAVTYKRDSIASSQPPNFAGWSRHFLGDMVTTGGTSINSIVKSICIGSNEDGTLETLTLVVQDIISGRHDVQMLTKNFTESDLMIAAWFLDAGIEPSSIVVGGTGVTLNGLRDHSRIADNLVNTNKRVTVFGGGLDLGEYFVPSNGSLLVPFFGGFTAAYAATLPAAAYRVGFNYLTRAQLVRPATAQESGARNGPALGKLRRTHMYGIQAINTNGLSIGTVFGQLDKVLFKSEAGVIMASSGVTYTGVYWDSMTDDYDFESGIAWEVKRPVPAIIAQIAGMLHTQDN